MKTFKFKQFYKIYMNGYQWFNFAGTYIDGCDFEEIFLLTIASNLIISNYNPPEEIISNILNRTFLEYSDNFRYNKTDTIRMYDKEEYYR